MSLVIVTVKITTPHTNREEYVFYTEDLQTPVTKAKLYEALLQNSPAKFQPFLETYNLRIRRKSKKNKRYVELANEEDYAVLNRSLQVKNCINLDIVARSKKDRTEEPEPTVSVEEPEDRVPAFLRALEELADNNNFGDSIFDRSMYENIRSKPSLSEFVGSLVNINDLGTIISDNLLNSEFLKNLAKLVEEQFTNFKNEMKEPASGVNHVNVCCDGCFPGTLSEKEEDISGIRYHCLVCSDFDLCEKCENSGREFGSHKADHPMIKIKKPSSYVVINKLLTEYLATKSLRGKASVYSDALKRGFSHRQCPRPLPADFVGTLQELDQFVDKLETSFKNLEKSVNLIELDSVADKLGEAYKALEKSTTLLQHENQKAVRTDTVAAEEDTDNDVVADGACDEPETDVVPAVPETLQAEEETECVIDVTRETGAVPQTETETETETEAEAEAEAKEASTETETEAKEASTEPESEAKEAPTEPESAIETEEAVVVPYATADEFPEDIRTTTRFSIIPNTDGAPYLTLANDTTEALARSSSILIKCKGDIRYEFPLLAPLAPGEIATRVVVDPKADFLDFEHGLIINSTSGTYIRLVEADEESLYEPFDFADLTAEEFSEFEEEPFEVLSNSEAEED